RVKYDSSDANKPGWKFAEYELQGVPVRLAMGMRDLENGTIEVARRDSRTKETRETAGIATYVADLLKEIQKSLFEKALAFRTANTHVVDDYATFKEVLETKSGFILAH